MEGKKLSALIDFDFIVNTEVGLIRFIREFFQDDDVFDLNVLNKSDSEILSLLYSRTHYNPLSIIMKKINKSDEDHEKYMDLVYNGYFYEYKKEIIAASTSSKAVMDFVRLMIASQSTNTYLSVKDDIEESSLRSYFNKSKIINLSDKSFIKSFDAYYAKDYRFFINNDIRLKGKSVYITNRKYNIQYLQKNPSFCNNSGITIMGKYHIKGENLNG